MTGLMPWPKTHFETALGVPAVGYKLYFYDAGTVTPRNTYTSVTGATANTNPVILDANGNADIWLDSNAYKVKLTDQNDVQIWVQDNIGAATNATGSAQSVHALLSVPTLGVGNTTEVAGYHPSWSGTAAGPVGGGTFVWDSNRPKTAHNGGTIISPTVPWDGTLANLSAFLSGTGETNPSGNGCWIRIFNPSSIELAWFGVPADGATEATSLVNKVIVAAYKLKANQLIPTDEIYQVGINFQAGKDYKIAGPILLPSGIILNGRGSRLIGTFGSASTTAYNDSAASLIETATLSGTTLTSNRSAALATNRIVGSEIRNFSFLNANCGINAISMNEQCVIEHCQYSNVSAAMRLKWCFYLRINQHIIRNSSQAANQYAILLHGGNHNAMSIKHVALVNASVGMSISGPASFGSAIQNCTFEEGKVSGSIGMQFQSDAYCAGWNISSNYFEGVKYGLHLASVAAIYGSEINTNIFNNNEYAVFAAGTNAIRITSLRGNSLPDDGGTNRNLVSLAGSNNDAVLQIPSIVRTTATGPGTFITNFTPSNSTKIEASYIWSDTADVANALGKAAPASANQRALNELPFEGANIISLANQVPFVTRTVAVNTLTIDTTITYDLSNVLVFNFYGNTDTVNYDLKGFIFGTTVSWVTRDPVGVTATVSNNGGNVRIVFGNLTAATPIINTTGMVRHV